MDPRSVEIRSYASQVLEDVESIAFGSGEDLPLVLKDISSRLAGRNMNFTHDEESLLRPWLRSRECSQPTEFSVRLQQAKGAQ